MFPLLPKRHKMLKASKRIVIITESVNRYGFRALVDGVDLKQYTANPIMLWMHHRAFGDKERVFLPIGNVIELRLENLDGIGKALTGQPVFDDTDDFAKSIYNKFENGTIRMASAGLIPVEWSQSTELLLKGQSAATLVKSILEEVSIVDIGADNNTLSIALYDENHELVKLSLSAANPTIPPANPKSENTMSKIELTAQSATALLQSLKLSADSDATAIVAAVSGVVAENVQLAADKQTLTTKVTELKSENDELKKAARKERIELMVNGAKAARKITDDEAEIYIALSLQSDESEQSIRKLLDGAAPSPTVKETISGGDGKVSRLAELLKLSFDELFKTDQLEELKSLDLSAYEEKKKQAKK